MIFRISLFPLILCAFLVEGTLIDVLQNSAATVKMNIDNKMREASDKVRQRAQQALVQVTRDVFESERHLKDTIDQHTSSARPPCEKELGSIKNSTHDSLWTCLQMARVVTDGVDIASGGFQVAANILDTVDNLMQSLTACIVGPIQSTGQAVACYISALGTLASGVAQNVVEVEHYVTVVDRDVADIHASVQLCRDRTHLQTVKLLQHKLNSCYKNNNID